LTPEKDELNFTLNDGKQDDNDEEEERDVEENTIDLVGIAVWRFDLVTDTTAGSHTLVQMEHEALEKENLN
jgi:hypothetical protein